MPHPFEYQAPTPAQTEAIKKVRAAFKELSDLMAETIPNCRERSLAMTNLEQANMWANKAIVFVGAV